MTARTKAERQAIDRAAIKCWCGNVAGIGQTLCGRHREPELADPAAAEAIFTIDADAHAFALQAAYRVSEDVSRQTVTNLFWAADRLDYDRAECDDGQVQRSEAKMRIARELDRRGIPIRDPGQPSSYSPAPERKVA